MKPPKFPLFSSHIDLAHSYWRALLQPGDTVIDTTCGNGFDTSFLAGILSTEGRLIALDKQAAAIQTTRDLIAKEHGDAVAARIEFTQGCHSVFPENILPESVKLIVYNLGYLPKGDKSIITQTETTLQSLSYALKLVQPGGAVSITCYSGHPGGDTEEAAVMAFCQALPQDTWNAVAHVRLNKPKAPSLILLQKKDEKD